ncbi:DedA family protein [Pseudonocardia alni]|uniref:DedA family protein n=1 Tax=Pseudonocardia alni TaxID=33907 RepID=UPI0033DAB45C
MTTPAALPNPLDATDLLNTFGTVGLLVVLFAETGLLIGFFLPGDSLLFTAGLFCATGVGGAHLSLPWVLVAAAAGAIGGAQLGYVVGRRVGRGIRRQRNRRILGGMDRAGRMLERYGPARAVVLARFVPVIRTVVNPLAGALGTPARSFAVWQTVGGLLWTSGLVSAGYVLGRSVPGVDQYLLPVVALVIAVSLVPLIVELRRERSTNRPSRETP